MCSRVAAAAVVVILKYVLKGAEVSSVDKQFGCLLLSSGESTVVHRLEYTVRPVASKRDIVASTEQVRGINKKKDRMNWKEDESIKV
jgi:hypothetical protein